MIPYVIGPNRRVSLFALVSPCPGPPSTIRPSNDNSHLDDQHKSHLLLLEKPPADVQLSAGEDEPGTYTIVFIGPCRYSFISSFLRPSLPAGLILYPKAKSEQLQMEHIRLDSFR